MNSFFIYPSLKKVIKANTKIMPEGRGYVSILVLDEDFPSYCYCEFNLVRYNHVSVDIFFGCQVSDTTEEPDGLLLFCTLESVTCLPPI